MGNMRIHVVQKEKIRLSICLETIILTIKKRAMVYKN